MRFRKSKRAERDHQDTRRAQKSPAVRFERVRCSRTNRPRTGSPSLRQVLSRTPSEIRFVYIHMAESPAVLKLTCKLSFASSRPRRIRRRLLPEYQGAESFGHVVRIAIDDARRLPAEKATPRVRPLAPLPPSSNRPLDAPRAPRRVRGANPRDLRHREKSGSQSMALTPPEPTFSFLVEELLLSPLFRRPICFL